MKARPWRINTRAFFYGVFMKSIMIVLLISFAAQARITDGKVTHKVEKNQIIITVEKGFHINEKAPMSLKFFVCDDKNTACEPHEIKPNVK